jgi:tetratricopeptide (TPR) repeat protein
MIFDHSRLFQCCIRFISVCVEVSSLLSHPPQGKMQQAVRLCTESISRLEKRLGLAHPDVGRAISTLANLHRLEGRFVDAVELYSRVVDIFERRLGTAHAYYAEALNNMGNVFYDWQRPGEALPLYERALAVQTKALGPDHQNIGITSRNLAMVCEALDDDERALVLYQDALRVRRLALAAAHPEIASLRASIRTVKRRLSRNPLSRMADKIVSPAGRAKAAAVAGAVKSGLLKGAGRLKAGAGKLRNSLRRRTDRPYRTGADAGLEGPPDSDENEEEEEEEEEDANASERSRAAELGKPPARRFSLRARFSRP